MAKINHLILHEVARRKDGESFSRNLRKEENSLTGITTEFAESLGNLFTKSNLNIGQFGVDGESDVQPFFEQFLLKYYSLPSLKCDDFVKLTQKMAKRFANQIETARKTNVKGGLFVFYEYEVNGKLWMAIAILQRSDAYNADDEDLEISSSEVIDIDRLHLGATVNLTDWSEGKSNRYIKFKAGLAKEVRDYFEEYIGCQRDKSLARHETKDLRKAITRYAAEVLELNDEEQHNRLNLAHTYIKEKQDIGEDVTLSSLAKHVFPDNNEDFVLQTTTNYDLGETISIDSGVLRTFKRISGKNKEVSISFNRDLLGKSVQYKPKKNGEKTGKLIIDSLPEALEKEIIEELG